MSIQLKVISIPLESDLDQENEGSENEASGAESLACSFPSKGHTTVCEGHPKI